ncbi:unnamed protein product [Cylicostephanus goldi]|uniref:Uncharacterized protein n=1 Tax=Cylicostephanus goldi TaxID=71465 RepID=A0A3P6S4B1_CYLGO|nr:unnamed protein product [Cylicostephanus goldi]
MEADCQDRIKLQVAEAFRSFVIGIGNANMEEDLRVSVFLCICSLHTTVVFPGDKRQIEKKPPVQEDTVPVNSTVPEWRYGLHFIADHPFLKRDATTGMINELQNNHLETLVLDQALVEQTILKAANQLHLLLSECKKLKDEVFKVSIGF